MGRDRGTTTVNHVHKPNHQCVSLCRNCKRVEKCAHSFSCADHRHPSSRGSNQDPSFRSPGSWALPSTNGWYIHLCTRHYIHNHPCCLSFDCWWDFGSYSGMRRGTCKSILVPYQSDVNGFTGICLHICLQHIRPTPSNYGTSREKQREYSYARALPKHGLARREHISNSCVDRNGEQFAK